MDTPLRQPPTPGLKGAGRACVCEEEGSGVARLEAGASDPSACLVEDEDEVKKLLLTASAGEAFLWYPCSRHYTNSLRKALEIHKG